MHGTPLTIIPNVNRMVLGFYETNTNGRRIISHGGDTQYFHSDLHLFLDDGVGYFISFNSAGKEGAVGPLREAFYRKLRRPLLPGPGAEGKVDEATAKEHAPAIAGSYIISRRAESTFLSILNMLQPIKVVDQRGRHDLGAVAQGPERRADEMARNRALRLARGERQGAARGRSEDGKVVRFARGMVLALHVHGALLRREGRRLADAGHRREPRRADAHRHLLAGRRARPAPLPQAPALHGREAKAYRWVRIGALASLAAIGGWIGTILAMFSDLKLLSRRSTVARRSRARRSARSRCSPGSRSRSGTCRWSGGAEARWLGKIWAVVLVFATAVCAWVAVAYHLVGISTNY